MNSREHVAAYLRAAGNADTDIILRALLVDDDCRLLAAKVVACGETAISAFDPSQLLDEAFTKDASGIILARSARTGIDERLSVDEVDRATNLWRRADRIGIPLLDYVLFFGEQARGLFAIHEAERIQLR